MKQLPELENALNEDFLQNIWEKKPALLRGVLSAPLLNKEELFLLCQEAAKKYRGGNEIIRLYTEGAMIRNIHKLLPTDSENLDSYIERVGKTLNSRFGLVIDNAQKYSQVLFQRTKNVLREVFAKAGEPFVECDIIFFIGNYRNTPVGIHQDETSILYANLFGNKTMRLWPNEGYQGKLNGENVPEVQEGSMTLTGGPLDLIYWPSSYWHIAETDGELASSISFGVLKNDRVLKHSLIALETLILEEDPYFEILPTHTTPGSENLPDIFKKIAAAIKSLPEDKIAKHLESQWLARISESCLPRENPEKNISTAENFKLRPDAMLTFRTDSPMLYIAANGVVLETPAHPGLRRFFADLQAGLTLTPQSDLSKYCGTEKVGNFEIEMDEDGLRDVLEQAKDLGIFV
jgi:hypothetical protein